MLKKIFHIRLQYADTGLIDLVLMYENKNKEVVMEWKKSIHFPPHLHEAIELVYVTDGTLELGVGQELYHMEEGDFAIVFPNVIHHYQVFDGGRNKAMYMCVKPTIVPAYVEQLQRFSPKYPVIHKSDLHEDVQNSMLAVANMKEYNAMLAQAYIQMILAHVFSEMKMVEKDLIGSNDIIYQAVEYVAKNFRETITLDKMANDLGVSKYVLSRMFSKTFHCNFNSYVNGVRLNYATAILESTQESITNLCLDCGFESQRTFNRVFKERFKVTPREYRNNRRSSMV